MVENDCDCLRVNENRKFNYTTLFELAKLQLRGLWNQVAIAGESTRSAGVLDHRLSVPTGF